MSGPSKKPTNLKIIEGGRVNRTRQAKEPKPDLIKTPNIPADLPDYAKPVWDYLAPKLVKAKLLSDIDEYALIMLCVDLAMWVESAKQVKPAELLTIPRDGVQPQPHPILIVQSMLNKRIVKLMNEFGMTPAARTRIQLDLQGDLFKDLESQPKTSEFF